MTIVLAFLVPSATARVAPVILIMIGVVLTFGMNRKSRFTGMTMITTVVAMSIWNIGIKTAAAQSMIAIGIIQPIFASGRHLAASADRRCAVFHSDVDRTSPIGIG